MENTIEKDGKTYIEFDVAKQLKYQKLKDIIILILISLAVTALVTAIISVVKNADIINKDALIIGMDKHGFVSCQCVDEKGVEWYSTETGFKTQAISSRDYLLREIGKIEVISNGTS